MAAAQSSTRWLCQMCRAAFDVTGGPEPTGISERPVLEQTRAPHSSAMGMGSVFATGSGKMDHSYVVLPKQRMMQGGHFPPPRPRLPSPPTANQVAAHSSEGRTGVSHSHVHGLPHQVATPAGEGFGTRAMEDSFVVLPSSAASIYRNPSEGAGGDAKSGNCAEGGGDNVMHTGSTSLDARIAAMQRVFDIASQLSQVEQPLCLECTRLLCEELDKEVAEAERDTAAYEALLVRLEARKGEAMSDAEFAKEKHKLMEHEKVLEAELAVIKQRQSLVNTQLTDLEAKGKNLAEREERYWHDFNDFKLQLLAHQEERDAIATKMEVTSSQLEALRVTNVFNDAFHIWHEGDFGTINYFRLGRLPNVPVEWDEINAAWGQACLLLHTMAQACRFTFSYRILPLGSYPRLADSRNTYDLYGPVNLFWSTRYDKAMVLYLACLKEFAEFANAQDRAKNIALEKCFQLPYKIEGDKVNGLTIKQSFNREERWTKALKYTLCDLKWALAWLVNHGMAQTPSPSASASNSTNTATPSPTPPNNRGSFGSLESSRATGLTGMAQLGRSAMMDRSGPH